MASGAASLPLRRLWALRKAQDVILSRRDARAAAPGSDPEPGHRLTSVLFKFHRTFSSQKLRHLSATSGKYQVCSVAKYVVLFLYIIIKIQVLLFDPEEQGSSFSSLSGVRRRREEQTGERPRRRASVDHSSHAGGPNTPRDWSRLQERAPSQDSRPLIVSCNTKRFSFFFFFRKTPE